VVEDVPVVLGKGREAGRKEGRVREEEAGRKEGRVREEEGNREGDRQGRAISLRTSSLSPVQMPLRDIANVGYYSMGDSML
jgi:hypothetical protein